MGASRRYSARKAQITPRLCRHTRTLDDLHEIGLNQQERQQSHIVIRHLLRSRRKSHHIMIVTKSNQDTHGISWFHALRGRVLSEFIDAEHF